MDGDSSELVAYKLLLHIMDVEGRSLTGGERNAAARINRAVILDAYAECLEAAKGSRRRGGRPTPTGR